MIAETHKEYFYQLIESINESLPEHQFDPVISFEPIGDATQVEVGLSHKDKGLIVSHVTRLGGNKNYTSYLSPIEEDLIDRAWYNLTCSIMMYSLKKFTL